MPPEQQPMNLDEQNIAQPSPEMGMQTGEQEMSPDRAMAALALSNKLVEDNFLQPQEEPMVEAPEEVKDKGEMEDNMSVMIEKAVKRAVKDELKDIREEIKQIAEEDDKEE